MNVKRLFHRTGRRPIHSMVWCSSSLSAKLELLPRKPRNDSLDSQCCSSCILLTFHTQDWGNIYVADDQNDAVYELDYADAPSLSFASTAVGATSSDSPQTVTMENVGNAALSLPVPSSGFDPSIAANFTWNNSGGTACPQVSSTSSSPGTLAVGSTCTLPISFTPTMAGSISGSLVLTDTNLNAAGPGYATQSISLSGTGTQVATQLAFRTAPTVNVPVGGNAGSAITVKEESSNSALDTSAADTITLTVTGPNSYSATYTATASGGIATFNLSSHALTTAGSYTYTASFTGLTSATATETVVAPSVNFSSSENVGSSTTAQTVTVYIATAGTVNTINVLTQGAANLDFTQAASPNGGTCATATMYSVGQTCTVNVIFAPKYPGIRYGAALLSDASGNVLGMVYLQGTGTGPQVNYSIVSGTSPSLVNSPGTQSTLGSGFSSPTSVAVDGSGSIYVADTHHGTVKEMVAVGGSIPASPTILTLGSGFGLPYGVAVDGSGNVYVADNTNNAVKKLDYAEPPSLSFASTAVGATSSDSPQSVTVANNGNATLTLSGLTVPVNWSAASGGSNCSSTSSLSEGGSCNFAISFSPLSAGNPLTGDVSLTDNSLNVSNATQSILLSGTGLAVAPAVAAVSAVSAPYSSTTGVTATATESGSAGVVTGGVVTFGTSGGVGGSFSPATCTLSSAGTCTTTYTPSGTLAAGPAPVTSRPASRPTTTTLRPAAPAR